ncbi:ACT domain-containing protein [Desulfobacula sp.]|uniref:ACT domain-containing protein n=1 Tax=Desulfobacula sp. TaxID=2593537 RepID=UPI002638D807|nr:ACT domain-containing protein [Desulfobacula sp.]
MTGILEIQVLLKKMRPVLDRTEYVFSTKKCFQMDEEIIVLNPIATFLESEGMTIVVSKTKADRHEISYDTIFNKITLEVHSSLAAVGLTAAVSTALASRNISANVVAGYYHDHIFIPKDKADIALETLEGLTE